MPPALAALVINADSGRVRVRKNVCTGCGLCESRCPTEPAAIRIEPARGERDVLIA
jgi:NAD-dependent dihydropyrimidine dehydrogenase PreA subunit